MTARVQTKNAALLDVIPGAKAIRREERISQRAVTVLGAALDGRRSAHWPLIQLGRFQPCMYVPRFFIR